MNTRIVVTGTDTGIGKTVFSAALAGALDAFYWKPVQAGIEEETDRDAVQRLSRLPGERVLREAYRLKTPASPHLAAKLDGVAIDPDVLALPDVDRPLRKTSGFLSRETGISGNSVGRIKGAKGPFDLQFLTWDFS